MQITAENYLMKPHNNGLIGQGSTFPTGRAAYRFAAPQYLKVWVLSSSLLFLGGHRPAHKSPDTRGEGHENPTGEN